MPAFRDFKTVGSNFAGLISILKFLIPRCFVSLLSKQKIRMLKLQGVGVYIFFKETALGIHGIREAN